ncbi:MAG: ATP-binding cassette domain-containing protein [Lachnospiraceae bacterium]|nr:ATP-binding cassette domain-containing protein [Lachnospiraceae bacterium]
MNSILETRNLTKYYGTAKVVDHVDITINKGDIYGLIGKNGAGKTTVMKLILSMVKPSEGSIVLFGEDVSEMSGINNRIGALIDNPAFYPFFSATENLEYYRRAKGLPSNIDINKLIKEVGLEEAENKKYKNFSLGMKQRLGIALALLGDPEFLVLDEPINGLDPEGIKEIRDLLIERNSKYGTTIFISSHILSELSQLATKYGVVHKGKILDEIKSSELTTDLETYFLETIRGL